MSHNPQDDAAAYLGGAMSSRRGKRFEAHLVSCEECWSEVSQARRGRAGAEALRELAPQSLREAIRASVMSRPASNHRNRPLWIGALAAAVAVSAVVVAVFLGRTGPPATDRQPESVAQALADFTHGRIPAEKPVSRPAPDLTQIGFAVAGTGAGEVGRIAVDGFSYRDGAGRRLQIYLSDEPFPEAAGARRFSRADGPWMASSNGVGLLCSEKPMPLLALSRNPEVLTELASYLRIG